MNSPKLSYPFSAFYAALTRGAFYSEVLASIVSAIFLFANFRVAPSRTKSHRDL
jgi:hypothetical protein